MTIIDVVPPNPELDLEKYPREKENRFYRPKKHWSRNLIDFEENLYLGKKPLAWVKILIFYLIFYALLLAYAVGLFYIFLLLRNSARDKKTTPALPLKRMKSRSADDYLYTITTNASRLFDECNEYGDWGYVDGSPCVFIKEAGNEGWKSMRKDPNTQSYPAKLSNFLGLLVSAKGEEKLEISCQFPDELEPRQHYFESSNTITAASSQDELEEDVLEPGIVPTLNKSYPFTDTRAITAVKLQPFMGTLIEGVCSATLGSGKPFNVLENTNLKLFLLFIE